MPPARQRRGSGRRASAAAQQMTRNPISVVLCGRVRTSGAIMVSQARLAALDAAGMDLRMVPAVLAVIVVGGLTGMLLLRGRVPGARIIPEATIGTAASAVVFALQSGSVGPSFGGAILALSAGALAVLLVAFFRNV
jgi:hypothetical protein